MLVKTGTDPKPEILKSHPVSIRQATSGKLPLEEEDSSQEVTAVQPAADGISVNAAASSALKAKQREQTEALRPSVSVRSFSTTAEQQQAALSRCHLEEVNV